jgi:hypothetical protein
MMTATNANGEGYKSETPLMVITQPLSFRNPANLFVWGNNQSSEIGLTEELVAQNKAFYVKKADKHLAILCKAVEHNGFSKVVQEVACGNSSTTTLCVDSERQETMVVQMGMTCVAKDEDDQINIAVEK